MSRLKSKRESTAEPENAVKSEASERITEVSSSEPALKGGDQSARENAPTAAGQTVTTTSTTTVSTNKRGRIKSNSNVDKKQSNPVRSRSRTNKVVNDGFDIEAPDREEDPTIEEAIVSRMSPNTSALSTSRKAVEMNDFSKVHIKFEDRRHALVAVDGEEFHAQLMDLPTVTEVHKTVDRRNIFKTVDVSQISLVTHKVGDPKPSLQQYTQLTQDPQSFPHGLTPPMYNVRNRRFQPHMSTKVVESIESQVEESLKRDAEAREVTTESLPASAVAAQRASAEAARAAAKARTEESDMDIDDDLDEELERAMMNDVEDDEDALADSNDMEGVEDEQGRPIGADGASGARKAGRDSNRGGSDDSAASASRSGSAAAANALSASEGEEDDEEDEDEDEDDDDDRQGGGRGEEDDDVRQHNKQLREEIKELEVTIQAKARLAGTVVNEIMRARHMDAVTRLRTELEKKRSLLRDAGGLENGEQAGSNAENNNDEDEDEGEDDDEDEDDDDDAPEMPEGTGLPDVPATAAAAAAAAEDDRQDELESNAADSRLRDQSSGQLIGGSSPAAEETAANYMAGNNDEDLDLDDSF